MPLGEIAGHLLIEVVLEILIKGPGFLIARMLKPDIDPESKWSIVLGVLFWGVLGGLGYGLYTYLAA